MKRLFLIVLVLFSGVCLGQQMTATQTTTEIDQKFVEVQHYITEAKKVVNTIIANEALSGEVKNKELIKQLILDLQATIKLYRPKFMKANEIIITVDSLETMNEKTYLVNEISRLKAEIAIGNDSTIIQPHINILTNRRNELNKIIKNWHK